MKEYMLLIRKQYEEYDAESQEFLKACETYINKLKNDGKLISAQPIESEDNMLLSKNTTWKVTRLDESTYIIGGYYHILAEDLDEAIEIAKANPEFEYHPNSRIEIRPIKTTEESTEFDYPKHAVESISIYDQAEMPF